MSDISDLRFEDDETSVLVKFNEAMAMCSAPEDRSIQCGQGDKMDAETTIDSLQDHPANT